MQFLPNTVQFPHQSAELSLAGNICYSIHGTELANSTDRGLDLSIYLCGLWHNSRIGPDTLRRFSLRGWWWITKCIQTSGYKVCWEAERRGIRCWECCPAPHAQSLKRRSTQRFIITEKAPTKAFSWLNCLLALSHNTDPSECESFANLRWTFVSSSNQSSTIVPRPGK